MLYAIWCRPDPLQDEQLVGYLEAANKEHVKSLLPNETYSVREVKTESPAILSFRIRCIQETI